MDDPADRIEWVPAKVPPRHGPGSGKDAWIAFAREMVHDNGSLRKFLDEQSGVIRSLRGEVALLKKRIAARKPQGGRPPLAEDLVARLEAELGHGGSDRAIAARYGVSHMTVHRLRVRRRQRQLVADQANLP